MSPPAPRSHHPTRAYSRVAPSTPWRRALRHRSFALGLLLTAALLLCALASWLWAPGSVHVLDMGARAAAPDATHWLGTDAFGRDELTLLAMGARVSMAVGFIAVGIGLAIGVALGLLAAAWPGWVDEIVMRVGDFAFAFPALLSAILLNAIGEPSLFKAILAIGIFNIPVFARVTRGAARAVWSRDYVLAARACGQGRWAIVLRHVLPNILPELIVQATIQFALAILAEAALSYLGLGAPSSESSWGRKLSEAQTLLVDAPLLAIWPGLAIALSVLGLNLLGDGLRDLLDPRLEGSR